MGEVTAAASGWATGPDASEAAAEAVAQVAAGLGGARPTLAMAFIGAAHTDESEVVADRVRTELAPEHLLGTTAGGVLAGGREFEEPAALSVWAATLPGASLTPLRYTAPAEGGDPADADPAALAGAAQWEAPPESAVALVMLADPTSCPAPALVSWLGEVRPGLPISGGMASGAARPGGNRLLLDDEVFDSGAVAIALEGVRVRTMVSQGCRPVGTSYTVTGADRNLLTGLAGAAPLERLREVYAAAPADDQERMQSGLHIGTAIDEYKDDFARGDFLVRGVLGTQQDSDALVVGDVVEVGQTVQFQVRDAASADDDLRALLADVVGEGAPAAALLFTCNGRGQRLFGEPDHDAALVRSALGGPPLAGFFCAGEIGPVGSRSFLHGFTASLLVFDPPTDGESA